MREYVLKKLTNFISHFTFHVSHRRNAFTLAEVLIVLSIIGVVAEYTIPSVISNFQKTEYVTLLKKAYSETNQALKQMAADYGCIDDLKCTGLFDSNLPDAYNTMGDALAKYFNIAKNCRTEINKHCWPDLTNENYDGTSDGGNTPYDSYGYYKFITSDGMSFFIINYKNNCSMDWSTGRIGNMKQMCGVLV